jgi:nucleotide-binding universal stress UspA family protein
VTVKIQKLLVPVDVSRDSLTALKIAFELAAAVGAEVSGLFIEDAELLAAGSLPFAREVGSRSGVRRSIGTADIEERLQFVAAKARDAIAEAGHARNVQSSFRVARGNVPAQILDAASEADIVVLGKAGWSIGELRRPGNTCLSILAESRIPVLVVERGATLAPPILAVHDETTAGKRAVDFARDLSCRLRWELGVFAVRGMTNGDEVLIRIRKDQARLIVLPSSLPLSERASELMCPVLFVP